VPLLISDTNIFIDLEAGDLLPALFSLPERIVVPDVLFDQELRARHEDLLDLGLAVRELQERAVERTVELAGRYGAVSRIDLSALALAEQESCPLLTGDRRLRDAATHEGVTVHGTLWVVRRLVDHGVPVDAVRQAFKAMRGAGRRLPWDRVRRLIQELESTRR